MATTAQPPKIAGLTPEDWADLGFEFVVRDGQVMRVPIDVKAPESAGEEEDDDEPTSEYVIAQLGWDPKKTK